MSQAEGDLPSRPAVCALLVLESIALTLAAAAAKSLQSCPTLCDPIDGSPPGSPVSGILQARIPEWIGISFSEHLPYPGIEPGFPTLETDGLTSEPPGKPKT